MRHNVLWWVSLWWGHLQLQCIVYWAPWNLYYLQEEDLRLNLSYPCNNWAILLPRILHVRKPIYPQLFQYTVLPNIAKYLDCGLFFGHPFGSTYMKSRTFELYFRLLSFLFWRWLVDRLLFPRKNRLQARSCYFWIPSTVGCTKHDDRVSSQQHPW